MSNAECEFNLPPLKKKRKSKTTEQEEPVISTPEIKEIKVPTYSYSVGNTNEFEKFVFNPLQGKIQLNPINPIQWSITKRNENLFLEVEGNKEDVEISQSEIKLISDIVGSSGPKLVALYFRIVHTSYPILSETKFLETFNNDLENLSPCLLASVYLFALNWWSFDSDLSSEIQPSQKQLEVIVETNLYKEFKRPTLSTIQAGLLLIQHQCFREIYENPNQGWAMQSAVWASAQAVGLNLDSTEWPIPQWEKSLRKRLAWALFVQEKWLSFCIDKTSHIISDDWAVPDLEVENDFQDFHINSSRHIDGTIDFNVGRTLFIQKVELTKIVDGILIKLNSNKSKVHLQSLENLDALDNLKSILNYMKPLHLQLSEWESDLPDILFMELNITRGHISGAPNIYISNFMAQVSILKPVLRSLIKTREDQILVTRDFMKVRDLVFNRCVAILDKILKFCNDLKAEHLQTFWYTSARTGFCNIVVFGYLVTLISKDRLELENCKDKLEEYIWRLKINNKNAEFLLYSIIWWTQLKKILTERIETIKFYNEAIEEVEESVSMPILNEHVELPDFITDDLDTFIFNH